MRPFVFARANTFFDASRRSVGASPGGSSGVQSMRDGELRLCTSRERRFDVVLARRLVRASASRMITRDVHDDASRASIGPKLHRRTSQWMPSLMALPRRGDCAAMRRSTVVVPFVPHNSRTPFSISTTRHASVSSLQRNIGMGRAVLRV